MLDLTQLEAYLQAIPGAHGTYALQLHLYRPRRIQVGNFGQALFPPGEYVYLGSAFGAGGLRARLGRHLRGDGKLHWHIDYLRHLAEVRGFSYTAAGIETDASRGTRVQPATPLECRWSQALARLPEACIPLAGFGAGDCHSGCRAHLVGFPRLSELWLQELRNTPGLVVVSLKAAENGQ